MKINCKIRACVLVSLLLAGVVGCGAAAGKDKVSESIKKDTLTESPPPVALVQPCIDYGRSFIDNIGPDDSTRFWVESRCLITDLKTGDSIEYYQTGSCKSEHTFAEKDLFNKDNFDFMPIFSERNGRQYDRVVFRKWAAARTRTVSPTGGWDEIIYSLRKFKGRVLSTTEEIVDAMQAGKLLVGQTEIRDEKSGRTALIEYPIKTINWHRGKKIWQVDTGPIILPDLTVDADEWSENIERAYIAYRTFDWADFVIEQPTLIMKNGKKAAEVYHYSEIVHKTTRNVILALDEDCKNQSSTEKMTISSVRQVSDYVNADGLAPDGRDNNIDDTEAIRKALADGPGIVYLGAGFYRCSNVTVPANVTLTGAGSATVIRSSGGKQIIVQESVDNWRIRDISLDGQAKGNWPDRKDEGRGGIVVNDCLGHEITGVHISNFNGAGLQLSYTVRFGAGSPESPGGVIESMANLARITAVYNYIGIRFDTRGEYMNATQLHCQQNVIGCVIHAGNVKISNSSFVTNIDGMIIEDKTNGSHGTISNCLFNHNDRYALLGRHITNGMAISNCCFFYGMIELSDCVGVNINSGMFACSIDTTASPKANRIADNYVHNDWNDLEPGYTFKFSPATIVDDNFDPSGDWELNTQ